MAFSSNELRLLITLLTEHIDNKKHTPKMKEFLNNLNGKLLRQIK